MATVGPQNVIDEIHGCRTMAVLRNLALRLAGDMENADLLNDSMHRENNRLTAEVERLQKFDNGHPKRCKCVECGP